MSDDQAPLESPTPTSPNEIQMLTELSVEIFDIRNLLEIHLAQLNRISSAFSLAVTSKVGEQGFIGPLRVIAEDVAHFSGCALKDLRGRSRVADIATARHTAIYLATRLTTSSTTQIGRFFDRDHTTVIHARDKIASWKDRGDRRYPLVAAIEEALSRKLVTLYGDAR